MHRVCYTCGETWATLGEPDTDHLFSYGYCEHCSRTHNSPVPLPLNMNFVFSHETVARKEAASVC